MLLYSISTNLPKSTKVYLKYHQQQYQYAINSTLFFSLNAQMRHLLVGNQIHHGGWGIHVMKTANTTVEMF